MHALPSGPRSSATISHGVAELAEAVAVELGLPTAEVERVRLAAALHDVGKMAIPDAILDQARAARRRGVGVRPAPHADRRADPARGPALAQPRATGALEPRALGRQGYPDGLAGERDPARPHASSSSATRSTPCLRPPVPPRAAAEHALGELRRCAGTQFDPLVVGAFALVVERTAGDGPLLSGLQASSAVGR